MINLVKDIKQLDTEESIPKVGREDTIDLSLNSTDLSNVSFSYNNSFRPTFSLSTSRPERLNGDIGVQSGISSVSGVQGGIGEGETRTVPDRLQELLQDVKGFAGKHGTHAARSGIKYTGDSAQELKAFHDFNATEAQLQSSFAARSGQINSGVEGFRLGSLADGLGEQSGRISQRANYLAQEGSYRDDAKFAQQIAGSMSAMGVSPGAFDPRNKPRDNDSMVAGGLFGADYNEAFSYPETGFLQEVGAAYNDISSSASSAKIHYSHNTEGNYFDDGLVSSLGHTVSSFVSECKRIFDKFF